MEDTTLIRMAYAYQVGMLCFIAHFAFVNPGTLSRRGILPWLLLFTLFYPLAYCIGLYGKYKKRIVV